MALRATFIFFVIFFAIHAIGQSRVLTGKVIDVEYQTVGFARVFSMDTTALIDADMNGNFSITISSDVKVLIVGAVGMELKRIELNDVCNNLEIILLGNATYDFMSFRKIDRLRKKEFDKLPVLHQAAFEKGIFSSNRPCYDDKFVPINDKLKRKA